MKRTGKLLESALDLLEALRPPRTLIGNEVAGHKCPEGLGRLSSAHVLIGDRITSEAYLCKEILGLGACGADVEQRGRAQRHAPAFATEVVLHDPVTRAALAQAQPEAAELVIPESLVLRARLQHQRLGGSRCQLHEMSSSWAGHGHVRPAPSCHLSLPPHSSYGKLRE